MGSVTFDCMLKALLPNSQTHKGDCYKLAWNALVNNPSDFGPEQRAHAKCWLTYRAVDGEITLADWLLKINPQNIAAITDPKCSLRWQISQATAEAYLLILTRQPWHQAAEKAWLPMASGGLLIWPGGATNAMRVCALLAYAALLASDSKASQAIAMTGIEAWRSMWATFNIHSNPNRFAELGQDAAPLWALTRLAKPEMGGEDWADALVGQAAGPWGRCMAELSKHKERLW